MWIPPSQEYLRTFIYIQMVSLTFPVCRPSHLSYSPKLFHLLTRPILHFEPDSQTYPLRVFYLPITDMWLVCYTQKIMQKTAVGLLCGDSDRYVWWENGAQSDAGTLRKHRRLWRKRDARPTQKETLHYGQHALIISLSILTCCVCFRSVA